MRTPRSFSLRSSCSEKWQKQSNAVWEAKWQATQQKYWALCLQSCQHPQVLGLLYLWGCDHGKQSNACLLTHSSSTSRFTLQLQQLETRFLNNKFKFWPLLQSWGISYNGLCLQCCKKHSSHIWKLLFPTNKLFVILLFFFFFFNNLWIQINTYGPFIFIVTDCQSY